MSTPAWTEQALRMPCAGDTLIGVLTAPETDRQRGSTGAVIVVGGPQYRAGSHRQFVQWARALAEGGVTALRFDVRGMGDSTGALRNFEQIDDDIRTAVDSLLAADPALDGVVLCGLCDGASAALLYLDRHPDPRVRGAVLLNPWVRSQQTLAQAQVKHYYLDRLRSPAFWKKLVSGGVAWRALLDLLNALRQARGGQGKKAATRSFQQKMLDALTKWTGPVMVALSGQDLTAQEFLALCQADARWLGQLSATRTTRLDLAGADHTLSDPTDLARFHHASVDWIHQHFSRPNRPGDAA